MLSGDRDPDRAGMRSTSASTRGNRRPGRATRFLDAFCSAATRQLRYELGFWGDRERGGSRGRLRAGCRRVRLPLPTVGTWRTWTEASTPPTISNGSGRLGARVPPPQRRRGLVAESETGSFLRGLFAGEPARRARRSPSVGFDPQRPLVAELSMPAGSEAARPGSLECWSADGAEARAARRSTTRCSTRPRPSPDVERACADARGTTSRPCA
jgi:hypothetical protein